MKVYSPHILKLRAVALTATLAGLLLSFGAHAAQTVHLTLTMNGVVIQGDSTLTSMGRENTIQCVSWESEIYQPGASTTPLVHRPIKFVKVVDKATALLAKALGENQTGSGTFRFYRPGPTGGGTEEQFLRVTLADVRVKSHRILSPNAITPATANQPVLEEVTLSYTSITIIYEPNGTEATLDVRAP